MSDAQPDAAAESPKRLSRVHAQPAVDEALDVLLRVVESGTELFVILSLSGGVVSGGMIPRRDFFAQLAHGLRTDGELGEGIAELFHDPDAPEISDEDAARAAFADLGAGGPFAFVHLRNARYLHSSGLVPAAGGEGLLMRVRTSDISAWSLGRLNAG